MGVLLLVTLSLAGWTQVRPCHPGGVAETTAVAHHGAGAHHASSDEVPTRTEAPPDRHGHQDCCLDWCEVSGRAVVEPVVVGDLAVTIGTVADHRPSSTGRPIHLRPSFFLPFATAPPA